MRTQSMTLATTAALALCLSACGGGSGISAENSVKQDGTGKYQTISDAVKAAHPGDTIIVYGGVYRESVVIPHGGTDDSHRITIKAAPGATVIVTGSDIATGWVLDSGTTWKLVQQNSAFGQYNPFATLWSSGTLPNSSQARSSGGVYANGTMLLQRATLNEVTQTSQTWTATVDGTQTTIYANFGGLNPNQSGAEINKRMQAITAPWNQSYITLAGLTIMHAGGPKGVNYWSPTATSVGGAVDTYGGSDWVIQGNTFTQNSGVALGFGVGAEPDVLANGGLPARFGHDLIQGNTFTGNATNGAFAYRSPFTEVSGNRFVDNDAANTGLLSEADLKFLDGGVNIKIHDNYFFSDHSYQSDFLWMDSSNQDTQVYGNVFYAKAGNPVMYEANFGTNVFANNILINSGLVMFQTSNTELVQNTLVNSGVQFYKPAVWPAGSAENLLNGFRRMELYQPNSTALIGIVPVDTTFNKIMNNAFYGMSYSPDVSIPGLPANTANPFTNNVIDYNVYYGGASKAVTSSEFGGVSGNADQFSVQLPAGTASATCDPNSCSVNLPVDAANSLMQIQAPAMTSAYMGANNVLSQQTPAITDYAAPITTDFFGAARGNQVVVGAIANLKAGANSVQVWPKQ